MRGNHRLAQNRTRRGQSKQENAPNVHRVPSLSSRVCTQCDCASTRGEGRTVVRSTTPLWDRPGRNLPFLETSLKAITSRRAFALRRDSTGSRGGHKDFASSCRYRLDRFHLAFTNDHRLIEIVNRGAHVSWEQIKLVNTRGHLAGGHLEWQMFFTGFETHH